MSRVQLTKKEAIAEIDRILDQQLDLCVQATYNELIGIVNENFKAGRRKIKGSLIIGYNPVADCYEDIRFDIDKAAILNVWEASLCGKRARLKSLEKYTSKHSIFCWDYQPHYTFGFKIFTDGTFGGMSKSGKLFAKKLSALTLETGLKLSYKHDGLVTNCKIKYTCNIPSDFTPNNAFASKKIDIADVLSILNKYNDNVDDDRKNIAVNENNVTAAVLLTSNVLNGRFVSLGTFVKLEDASVTVAVTIGRVSPENIDYAQSMIEQYNGFVEEDDFFAILTEPDGDFDGQLMFMKQMNFNDAEDLATKIHKLYNDSKNLCENPNIHYFVDLTYPL